MNALTEAAQLRPLSIGEIFDRAVTLLVKNAGAFAIVALVGVLPSRFIGYLAVATANSALRPLGYLAGVFDTVAAMAAAVLVAQIYAGESPHWPGALAVGFKRILRAIGVNIMLAIVAFIPLGIVAAIAIPAKIFRFGNLAADAAAFVLGLLFIAWGFAFVLASLYSYCAIAIDDRDAGDCVVRAFGLFAGAHLARTLLFALAAGAALLGGSFIAGFALGFVRMLLHMPALAYAVDAALMVVPMAFVHTLAAVFYFDTRVREEGYDLQAMLAALEPVP